MKKIALLILVVIAFASCKEEAPKDYVTLSGKVLNPSSNTLTILGDKFRKDIKINEDGTFSDTLKVKNGFHGFNDGKQQSFLYLRNGYDMTLNFDAQNFPESIEFSGNGAGTNKYLTEKIEYIDKEGLSNPKPLFMLDKADFDKKIAEIEKFNDDLLKNAKDLDPEVRKMEEEQNKKMIDYYKENYEAEHQRLLAFMPGKPSPKFNYPDPNGKMVSLDDFKGKYVYVDVWATWCAPCKREIPYLKELYKEYKNKDIVFVSLSIDKPEDKEKWLKMIKDENMNWVQIFGDKAWNTQFVRDYGIRGIPRFILIDKEGNILNPDAPRPSSQQLKAVLSTLDL